MIAKIRLHGDLLVAEVSDGTQLANCDAKELADMLRHKGIRAQDVSAIDRDLDAPMKGHMIAIFSRLHLFE